MKTYFLLFLSLVASSFALAQSTRDVPVANFYKLNVQGNMVVELTQGDKASVKMSGSNEALDDVTVTTSGSELTIKTKLSDQLFKKSEQQRHKTVRVQITYTSLAQLTTGRGADVKARSVIEAEDLEIRSHTGSLLNAEVKTPSLKLEINEGAQVEISGKATVQKTSISTGAELKAEDLLSEIVTIRSSTGAMAEVNATKRLDASAGTGANIRYRGKPAQRDINTSLGGEISQL